MGKGDTKFIMGMRDAYFEALFQYFKQDRDAIFITADNGAPTLDQFAEQLPDQFFNVGIAEQQLIGMAAGMAFEGKKVFTYAIAPFVTLRCYEQLKIDVCAMNLPVVSIGVGAGYAYDIMGPTHHTVEDISIMRALPNMKIYSPADSICAEALAEITFRDPAPQYVRFDRAGLPNAYTEDGSVDFSKGLCTLREGSDVAIIATGVMLHEALAVAERLATQDISARVIDLYRLKPVDAEQLFNAIGDVERVVTMEEHLLAGGMGSIVAEMVVDAMSDIRLLRIGQNDRFVFENGGREVIWELYGLDQKSVTDKVLRWLGD